MRATVEHAHLFLCLFTLVLNDPSYNREQVREFHSQLYAIGTRVLQNVEPVTFCALW